MSEQQSLISLSIYAGIFIFVILVAVVFNLKSLKQDYDKNIGPGGLSFPSFKDFFGTLLGVAQAAPSLVLLNKRGGKRKKH